MPRQKAISLDGVIEQVTLDFHRNRGDFATLNGVMIEDDSFYAVDIAARALGTNRSGILSDVLSSYGAMHMEPSGKISGYEIRRRKAFISPPKDYLIMKGMAEYFSTSMDNITLLLKMGFLDKNVKDILTRDSFNRLFEKVLPKKGTDNYAKIVRLLRTEEKKQEVMEIEPDSEDDDDAPIGSLNPDEVIKRLSARRPSNVPSVAVNSVDDYLDGIDTKSLPVIPRKNGAKELDFEYRSLTTYNLGGKGFTPGKDFTLISAHDKQDADSANIRAYNVILRDSSDIYVNAADMDKFLWGYIYSKQGKRLGDLARGKSRSKEVIAQKLELAGMPSIVYKKVAYGPPGSENIIAISPEEVEGIGKIARKIANFDGNGLFMPRPKIWTLVRGVDEQHFVSRLRGIASADVYGRIGYSAFGVAKEFGNFMAM